MKNEEVHNIETECLDLDTDIMKGLLDLIEFLLKE